MQADDAIVKGDVVEIIPEPIHVEDSSPESPPQNKKPRNLGTGARKIPASPKIAPTLKVGKEKRAASGKTTDNARKMASN